MKNARGPIGVFLILLASYAYFWHSRDWNSATRLMLTYSLVDRGDVRINGLEDHTRDRARVGDRYYTDKMPGHSLLGVPVYGVVRALGMPPHPLDRKGPEFPHYPADYWVTLGTSGLATALCGAILTALASGLGCGPRRSILVGLAYGLATPAYVFATLNYGHQTTACLQLIAFAAIACAERSWFWPVLAGFCASYSAVIELQCGPVAAILGFYLLARVMTRIVKPTSLLFFGLGAIGPVAILLGYNIAAFGSPFDMGYFHEDLAEFRTVHADDNPLGLSKLNFSLVPKLLWSEFRGLLVYAPILLLTVPGWIVLAIRRRWDVLCISIAICVSVFLVNLSYPMWTGGWSTGPRFLLPLIPFAMLGVAAFLSLPSRTITILAAILAIIGWAEMSLFQGVGGRIPDSADAAYQHPLREVVWPMWIGEPLPMWKEKHRFDRTIADSILAERVEKWPVRWRGLQFVPFWVMQWLLVGCLFRQSRPRIERSPDQPANRSR